MVQIKISFHDNNEQEMNYVKISEEKDINKMIIKISLFSVNPNWFRVEDQKRLNSW